MIEKIEDPNVKKFLEYIKKVCKEYGVKIKLVNHKTVKLDEDNNRCLGYFLNEPDPVIVVAVKKPLLEWLAILSHEFCHCMQWIENDKTWERLTISKNIDALTEVGYWLSKQKELKKKKLDLYISRIMEMEYNCDKRSAKLIKKFNLPIDLKIYKQQSIAYVWFYVAMKQNRSWYKNGNAPYKFPEIYKTIPMKWVSNPHKPSKKFLELVNEKCF